MAKRYQKKIQITNLENQLPLKIMDKRSIFLIHKALLKIGKEKANTLCVKLYHVLLM